MTDRIRSILLRAIPTGRKWGDKIEEKRSTVTIGGVKCTLVERDSWEGGDSGIIRQQYHRTTWLEYPEAKWNYD
jgi:hypothetical protein